MKASARFNAADPRYLTTGDFTRAGQIQSRAIENFWKRTSIQFFVKHGKAVSFVSKAVEELVKTFTELIQVKKKLCSPENFECHKKVLLKDVNYITVEKDPFCIFLSTFR
ncbi:hypothetical protein TNCV_3189871 [Trichonephila clavipes]|nr:hypothetical protein TNCV_3189871 [Trichonephila clavipes]